MIRHWFWFVIVAIVVLWYSSVTIYVSIRGFLDIKQMLRKLAENRRREESEAAEDR
jgi:hypothetical protein